MFVSSCINLKFLAKGHVEYEGSRQNQAWPNPQRIKRTLSIIESDPVGLVETCENMWKRQEHCVKSGRWEVNLGGTSRVRSWRRLHGARLHKCPSASQSSAWVSRARGKMKPSKCATWSHPFRSTYHIIALKSTHIFFEVTELLRHFGSHLPEKLGYRRAKMCAMAARDSSGKTFRYSLLTDSVVSWQKRRESQSCKTCLRIKPLNVWQIYRVPDSTSPVNDISQSQVVSTNMYNVF